MYLTDLIQKAGLNSILPAKDDFSALDIKGVETDSRKIAPGYLFIALPGSKVDGLDYVQDALNAGACAILIPQPAREMVTVPEEIAVLASKSIRRDTALIAAAFYPKQPQTLVAVTGTNGKTSVVNFIRQIWESLGINGGSLGTVGLRTSQEFIPASLTTPDPVSLHRDIDRAVRGGLTHLAIEASSHGLHQHRLDGLKIHGGAFTNLTHEHLDYHETYENYRKAKGWLFETLLPEGAQAVLNADSKEYSFYKDICENTGLDVISYGRKGRQIKILERFPTPKGQEVRLEVFGTDMDIFLPLVGEFQLMNVLCACALAITDMEDGPVRLTEILEGAEHLKSVTGRLQAVPGHPEGAAVYVDYAHSPDALETVLNSLRPHVEGKLVCLFGCGGDRDRAKRLMMGKISRKLADKVIVSDDNPRTEDPAAIRKEILQAVPEAVEIGSRKEAIERAVFDLEKGDVLLVAGKGHEQGQLIGKELHPFDDVEQVRNALKKLGEN